MLKTVTNLMNSMLKKLDNPYVMGSVTVFLVLYGALVKPELPGFLKDLLKNDLVRVFYVFLIAYVGDKNLMVAMVIAFAFMVLSGLLSEMEMYESFENTGLTGDFEEQLNKLLDELDTVQKGAVDVAEGDKGEEQNE